MRAALKYLSCFITVKNFSPGLWLLAQAGKVDVPHRTPSQPRSSTAKKGPPSLLLPSNASLRCESRAEPIIPKSRRRCKIFRYRRNEEYSIQEKIRMHYYRCSPGAAARFFFFLISSSRCGSLGPKQDKGILGRVKNFADRRSSLARM